MSQENSKEFLITPSVSEVLTEVQSCVSAAKKILIAERVKDFDSQSVVLLAAIIERKVAEKGSAE